MKYTKPEIFTEKFDVEDVITASSGTPEPPVYDPPTPIAFEGEFLTF